jgi:hypothetical protein
MNTLDEILTRARQLGDARNNREGFPTQFAILVDERDVKHLVSAIEMLVERCKRAERLLVDYASVSTPSAREALAAVQQLESEWKAKHGAK